MQRRALNPKQIKAISAISGDIDVINFRIKRIIKRPQKREEEYTIIIMSVYFRRKVLEKADYYHLESEDFLYCHTISFWRISLGKAINTVLGNVISAAQKYNIFQLVSDIIEGGSQLLYFENIMHPDALKKFSWKPNNV